MKIVLFALSILVSSIVFAQSGCSTRIANIQEYYQLEADIMQPSRSMNSTCKTIRVVVHVVYDGAANNEAFNGNITPEQVKSQLRITNQFFRNDSLMTNEGSPLGYQLELAHTDPEGNPTTGIIYHDGSEIFGSAWSQHGLKNNNVNAISAGTLSEELSWGADADGKKYLNSYVVSSIDGNSGGGVQAFAYFPTSSVVFANYNLYNAFGAEQLEDEYDQTFNLKSYTDMGYTWTHELLHNFAIFHTFQGNSCMQEDNSLVQGDRVADTAPQTQGSGCSGACGDISYNVMDYLNQTCKNRITAGQAERADAAIQNSLADYLVCSDCGGGTGDFNGDGEVTVVDLSLFSGAFSCVDGDSCYDQAFDLNCDGLINIIDLSLISF